MTTTHTSGRATRAVLAAVGVGALAASVCFSGAAGATGSQTGSQTSAASSPGPHAQGIVWMDDLLHPIDLAEFFEDGGTITSRTGPGDGSYGLSACTGETRMRDVVGPDANLFFGVFTGHDGPTGKAYTVPQHVADQATATQAAAVYRTIVADVLACQDEPAGHWHYGSAHHVSTSVGVETWMSVIAGDGTIGGGIIVARSGRHVSVAEADGAGSPHEIEGLAAGVLARLR